MNGLSLALLAALLVLATASPAAPAKPAAGPRGGRLLTHAEPRAELLIGKDRTVSVAFYDAAGKRQAPAGQAVTVIAETPAGPTRLELAPKDDLLASTRPLPAGDGYQLVVQLTPAPGAKPRNFRFRLDLSHCSGCQLAEYACYCGH